MSNSVLLQSPKPSCHDALVGNWVPTEKDLKCGRKPGFGVTINIVNGGERKRFQVNEHVLECPEPFIVHFRSAFCSFFVFVVRVKIH